MAVSGNNSNFNFLFATSFNWNCFVLYCFRIKVSWSCHVRLNYRLIVFLCKLVARRTMHLHLCSGCYWEKLTSNMPGWHPKEHDSCLKQFRSDEKAAISSGMQQFDGRTCICVLSLECFRSTPPVAMKAAQIRWITFTFLLRESIEERSARADLFATRGIHQTETEFWRK